MIKIYFRTLNIFREELDKQRSSQTLQSPVKKDKINNFNWPSLSNIVLAVNKHLQLIYVQAKPAEKTQEKDGNCILM